MKNRDSFALIALDRINTNYLKYINDAYIYPNNLNISYVSIFNFDPINNVYVN